MDDICRDSRKNKIYCNLLIVLAATLLTQLYLAIYTTRTNNPTNSPHG